MQTVVKILLVLSALLFSAYYIQTYLDDYETRTEYVQVPYQEPIYMPLYSGKLTYFWIFPTYSFKDATSVDYDTESMLFGLIRQVKICWESKCKKHLATGGYDEIQTYPSQIVIKNETKYRTEPIAITKQRWDWYFS